MARPGKPVQLMVLEGKTHLTKAEIERREKAEIQCADKVLKADPAVIQDKRAYKEFKKLKKLYQGIEFVGALDSHIINQYCMAVSELDDLVYILSMIRSDLKAESAKKREAALKRYLVIDVEIRQKRAEIVKLGDRIYLNPVARMKHVPQKGKEEKAPDTDMFGDTG